MLNKRSLQFWKKAIDNNKFENKSKNELQTGQFYLDKRRTIQVWQRKAVELVEFGWYTEIIFYKRHSIFYRVWLIARHLNPCHFFAALHFFDPRHPCHPRHPCQNFMDPRYPRHSRQILIHAPARTARPTRPTSPRNPRNLADSVEYYLLPIH